MLQECNPADAYYVGYGTSSCYKVLRKALSLIVRNSDPSMHNCREAEAVLQHNFILFHFFAWGRVILPCSTSRWNIFIPGSDIYWQAGEVMSNLSFRLLDEAKREVELNRAVCSCLKV